MGSETPAAIEEVAMLDIPCAGTEDNDIGEGGDQKGGRVRGPLQPQNPEFLPGSAPPLPDIPAVYTDAI